MTVHILYPALAGYQQKISLWPAGKDTVDPTPSVVTELIDALKRVKFPLRELQPITLPIVDPQRAGKSESAWVPVEKLGIDALIAAQADEDNIFKLPLEDVWIAGGYTTIPAVLHDMPTLSHCAALWGYLAGAELRNHWRKNISPLPEDGQDEEKEGGILHSLGKYLSPHTEHHLHDIDGLKRTPMVPIMPPQGNARWAFMDLLAARISHCLSVNRPVHFIFLEKAPTDLIASMIESVKGDFQ